MMKIIFEDKNILIVSKPNNIASQKDKRGKDGLLEILQKDYKNLHIINRLDTNVSGLVLFAKNKLACDKLTNLVKDNQIQKTYYAVVDVSNTEIKQKDILENWLFKNQRLNISKVVNKNSPSSKLAKLEYEVVENFQLNNKNYCYVKINLLTGRHHQIRVQFAHICDGLYGDKKYNKNFKHLRENIALCAKELKFIHPFTNKEILISSDFPNDIIWNDFNFLN